MQVIMDLVHFSDEANLTYPNKRKIREWPVLLQQLEERAAKGFEIRDVTIKGVAWFGPHVGFLLARVEHGPQLSNGKWQSYHVAMMSPASSLLVVFRDHGKRITNRKPLLRDHHALLVEQSRFAAGGMSVEMPAVILNAGETPEEGAWRAVTREIGNTIAKLNDAAKKPFRWFHSFMTTTEKHNSFIAEIDVTSRELAEIRELLVVSDGGAGRDTKPVLMTLHDSRHLFAGRDGNAAWPVGYMLVTEYMYENGFDKETESPKPPARASRSASHVAHRA